MHPLNNSRIVFIGLLSCLILISMAATAFGDTLIYMMDDVVVTASRTPTLYHELARSVIVIGLEDNPGGSSLNDILRLASGVDIRQRGAHGAQADVSIRGGSFEQTLILIDGIKVTDPQTGHHNLDIPVSTEEIDRIEILKGPAARLYGPNAFDGVINIITRPITENRTQAGMSFGGHGLYEQSLMVSMQDETVYHRAAIERRLSTGYRDNTEYDLLTFSYRSGVVTEAGRMGLSVRYSDKEFGAYRFYSDRFPDEWEATETLFLETDGRWQIGSTTLAPKLFYRRHEDDFVLDRSRPDWYRNRHTTDQYGAEFQTTLTASDFDLALGGELVGEEIKSGSLGNHYRLRGGLFFEARFLPLERLSLIPGASLYRYTDWDWNIWPGLDIGYRLGQKSRLYAAVGKSFRVPTYTELYYLSPANTGNENLRPEKSWTYEAGLNVRRPIWEGAISAFHRNGQNLIDWVRSDPDFPWQAQNIASVNTSGVELSANLLISRLTDNLPLSKLAVQYQYLDSDHESCGLESKYIADHLKHQLIGRASFEWGRQISQNLTIRYADRLSGDSYTVVDSHLSWHRGDIELFVEGSNLFDTEYSEIGTIPMPGRWLKTGFRLNLSK